MRLYLLYLLVYICVNTGMEKLPSQYCLTTLRFHILIRVLGARINVQRIGVKLRVLEMT